MKSTLLLFLFPLFSIGVFCTDVKEPVSVMVGDSVTLHINTKIHAADVIVWSFGQKTIAMIDEGSIIITTSDENLKDRLQLVKQTGDLKIRNIKTTDSGDYKLDITRASRTEESVTMTFGVSVVSAAAVESVSVLVRDSVTLQTGLTEIQRDAVIQWRFGQQKSPVAEINKKAGIFKTFDGPDERFRDRLQLDHQTGSLNITNITITDSGLYEVEIISTSRSYTRHLIQSFTVTVRDAVKSVSVTQSDTVTILIVTEIQKDDQIQWMFGDTVLAKIHKAAQQFLTYNGPDERFRGRLNLDHQTGSLIITDTRTTHSGLYEVKINSSRHALHRKIIVTVNDAGVSPVWIGVAVVGVLLMLVVAAAAAVLIYLCNKISQPKWSWKTLSVIEGETVPLIASGTEFSKEDNIRWLLNKSPLAEIKRKSPQPFNILHENFKDRLYWPKNHGPLNIENIRFQDSGLYELQIIRSENNIQTLELFMVVVFAKTDDIKTKEVKEGGSVTLESGVTGIQKDDEILWKFGLDIPIAAIQGGKKKTPPFGADWRSIFRLKLDENGSLTIRNVGRLQAGFYALHITRSGNASLHLFRVKISTNDYADGDSEVIQMLKDPSKTQQSNGYVDEDDL